MLLRHEIVEVNIPTESQAAEAATAHSADPATHAMEHWISYVLRWGVMTSAVVILLGGAIFILAGPAPRDPHSLHQLLHGEYSNRSSLQDNLTGLKHHRGLAVVDIGLMLLILTPVLRVGMTFLLFAAQKDWIFTALTAVVLAILILGISGVGL